MPVFGNKFMRLLLFAQILNRKWTTRIADDSRKRDWFRYSKKMIEEIKLKLEDLELMQKWDTIIAEKLF